MVETNKNLIFCLNFVINSVIFILQKNFYKILKHFPHKLMKKSWNFFIKTIKLIKISKQLNFYPDIAFLNDQ